jgi:RHS repeat-associated protein
VTSANPAIAAVPASVAFASGQTSVALPVSGLASGSTTIRVSANGGQAAATVNVNAPPTVSITAPANNAVFAAGASIALNATAADSDGTVAKVEFYDGATLIGSALAAPYGATLASAPAGSHTLTAVATDNLGASTTSAALSVMVDAPPAVSLSAPANNAVFVAPASITLSASATDAVGSIVKVDFYQGATLIGSASASPYSFTWTKVAAGSYSLTAVATNDAGMTATSAATAITVRSAVAQIYYIHVDHLNTPRLVADATGTTVWRWDQDEPFGVNVPDENPSGLGAFDLPLRLPGQYFDKEMNLHYNYFRDYDAGTGRYLQGDPIGLRAGVNVYAYVGGRPISIADPVGLLDPTGWPVIVEGAAVAGGVAISTVAAIVGGVAAALYSRPVGQGSDMPSPSRIEQSANDPEFGICPPNCDFWRKWIRNLKRRVLNLLASQSVANQQAAYQSIKSLNKIIDQFNLVCLPNEDKLPDPQKIEDYYPQ